MESNSHEPEGTSLSAGTGVGMPPDFWVGVSLISLAVFFFILAAAGTLGEGGGDGHGKAAHGEEAEKARIRSIIQNAEAQEKAGRFEDALTVLKKINAATHKDAAVRSRWDRILEARNRVKVDEANALVKQIQEVFDSGGKAEAKTMLDEALAREKVPPVRKILMDTRARLFREAAGPVPGGVISREDAEPLDLMRDKFFILPCETWGVFTLGIDPGTLSKALFAECIAAFGASGISLEPLKAELKKRRLSAIAHRLAYGAFHMVDFHQAFDMSRDTCGRGIDEYPLQMAQVAELAKAKLGLPALPKYAFAFALTGLGKDKSEKTLNVRVTACIYDLQAKLVHSCMYFKRPVSLESNLAKEQILSIPGDVAAAMLKLPEEGKKD
ncbi:MAG: hypothetical protein ACYTHM_12240 [Planctomycetota bacterium]|jgi:hypothetical protein